MSPPPPCPPWAALCIASLLGLALAAALHGPANDCDPPRAPSFIDQDAEWEINPRRPC